MGNLKNNIDHYMKLKGIYNRVISIEEIQEICDYKQITMEQFIEKVCKGKILPMNTLKVKNRNIFRKIFSNR